MPSLFLLVNLHPVRSGVHPSGVRVAHHDDVAGAQVASAVLRMPERRGELRDVHLGLGLAILQHRAILHLPGRHGGELLQAITPLLHELLARQLGGQVEAQADARQRRQHVRQQPVAIGMALDLLEQQGRVLHIPLVEIRQPADLQIGVGALDAGQLTQLLDPVDPFAQVLHWHSALLRPTSAILPYESDSSGGRSCQATEWADPQEWPGVVKLLIQSHLVSFRLISSHFPSPEPSTSPGFQPSLE